LEKKKKLREHLRAKLAVEKDDFVYFCSVVGKSFKIKALKDFQIEWVDAIKNHDRVVIFAPIEHGKSSIISILYPLRSLGKNPDLRIALISDTDVQAKKFLSAIKQKIKSPEVRMFFPRLKPGDGELKWWREQSIIVDREVVGEKEPSIQAIGVRSAILGARLDLVIADDVINEKNSSSLSSINRVIHWWKTVITSRMTENSKIIFVGNAWDPRDLAHTLAKSGEYHVIRQEALDSKRRPILPEVWSLQRLAQRRRELMDDAEYKRQFFNICPTSASHLFPNDIILSNVEEDLSLGNYDENTLTFIGVDLAFTKSGKDQTVIFTLGVEPPEIYRVIDIEAGKWDAIEIIEHIKEKERIFKPQTINVESNAAQVYITQMLEHEGYDVSKFYTISQKRSRTEGIYSMSRSMKARRWRIPSLNNEEIANWVDELQRYDPNKHPGDRLVASWVAWCAAKEYLSNVGISVTQKEPQLQEPLGIADKRVNGIFDYKSPLKTDLWS